MKKVSSGDRAGVGVPKSLTWRKEDGNSGPRGGEKAPNQLLVKADYGGQVVELSMVDVTQQKYSLQALKSKVMPLSW
jgi:hypothetical protein